MDLLQEHRGGGWHKAKLEPGEGEDPPPRACSAERMMGLVLLLRIQVSPCLCSFKIVCLGLSDVSGSLKGYGSKVTFRSTPANPGSRMPLHVHSGDPFMPLMLPDT